MGGGPGESTGTVSMSAAGDLIARMLTLQADQTGQDVTAILNPAHTHDDDGEARLDVPGPADGQVDDG